jgi:small subunit ribosomal protein S7
MNKNLSKNSQKSLRVYILSEIRERRKPSAQQQMKHKSFGEKVFPKSSPKNSTKTFPKASTTPRSPGTSGVHGSFRNRQARPPQISREKVFPKTSPKNSWQKTSKMKTLTKPSTKILPKKKVEKNQKVFKVPEKKSTGLNYPCLFVEKVHQKTQEVIGSRFMNQMIRFITKQGKKSFASESMNKVRSILTNFEADKKDLKKVETSSSSLTNKLGSVKLDRKPRTSVKSQKNPQENSQSKGNGKSENSVNDLKKTSEDMDQKMSPKFETYKSRKLSQFLSRQKLKSSENFGKQFKNDVKILKKTQKKKLGYSPLSPRLLIEQAISSVKPFVEVKKVRVAGSTYQVPAILKKHRQENYAMKWILQSALERHKKNRSQSFEYCLAFEIYEASKKQGQARMKRNELHKLAESHRAFAHFRWW